MSAELSPIEEALNGACLETNVSRVDELAADVPPNESVVDDSINPENIEDDEVNNLSSTLHKLLLKMAEDGQSEVDHRALCSKLKRMDKAQVNTRHVGARELIKAGADISIGDEHERQPLHDACLQGHTALARLLLEKGADKSNIDAIATDKRWTALHAAIAQGHEGVVCALREQGARLDIQDSDGDTPLMKAILKQRSNITRMLLNRQPNDEDIQLETRDNSGRTPLLLASMNGFLEGVRHLIAAGADCNAASLRSNYMPLMSAADWGFAEIVQALLDANGRTDVNFQNRDGSTALHVACDNSRVKIVPLLLKHQAGVNIKNKDGQTALHLASQQGNENVFKVLIEARAPVDEKGMYGLTALHLASYLTMDLAQEDAERREPYGLSPEERHKPEFQDGRYAAVVEILVKQGANPAARANRNETALHLAASLGDRARLDPILEYMDPGDISVRNDDGQTALCYAFHGIRRETALKILLASDKLKTAEFDRSGTEDDALRWAAKNPETHDIAKWLMQKWPAAIEATQPPGSGNWSAIEWATHRQFREVLWWLIATSRRTHEIETAVKSALNLTRELKSENRSRNQSPVRKSRDTPEADRRALRQGNRGEQGGSNDSGETSDLVQPTVPGQRGVESDASADLNAIADILRDPPFARLHRDSEKYEQPRAGEGLSEILGNFEATVVQFYKDPGESGTIRRYRPVQQVIYDDKGGPKKIMADSMGYFKTTPKFTWVHLPATNMVWMTDLLTRIMKDEKYEPRSYREVKSFFRDSWIEVPDRTSSSRTMRPRAMVRRQDKVADQKRDEDKQKKCRKRNKPKKGEKGEEREEGRKAREGVDEPVVDGREDGAEPKQDAFVTASAIYMPYFCFSSQCCDGTPPSQEDIEDKDLQRLRTAKESYKGLLDAYKSSAIHGSPTLDEWYYHFANGDGSTGDKKHRNETQVVTKFLEDETSKRSHWRLLRVNQLWVWTIANKWLITATSCLFDDSHDSLVKGILGHLVKQAESGGSGSQPGSADYMSRLIVNYCVVSYERRPETKDQLSIRQVFSNYMNRIGRNETKLFEDFSLRTQSWQQQTQSDEEERAEKGSLTDEASPESSAKDLPKLSPDDDIRNAIKKAEKLYCDIKDVRDELNILKSAAQYQMTVQRGLTGNRVKDADLTAADVVNDIKEMDIVANRIQSAVNTTLSLQQSEIANFQAAIAAKQASLATNQGKILLVFTFATLLFLPLSFLSSLFALDVASFKQTPGWVFGIIFGVSVPFSILVASGVILWDTILAELKRHIQNVGKKATKAEPSSLERKSVGTGERDVESLRERTTSDRSSLRSRRPFSRFGGHARR